jgi:hypothetical protein
MTEHLGPWAGVLALGMFHGINPGMGWLFAVALGMQERSRRAVWWALVPLTLGHALAMAAVVALAVLLGVAIPASWLKWPVAATLAAFGCYRLYRHQHIRGGGMRVGMAGLTGWSFMMASCHGAGLMVLPLLLRITTVSAQTGHHHHAMPAMGPDALTGTVVTGLHMVGYLVVTALVAVVVFERLGLQLLRRLWFNLDLVWAIALIGTAAWTAWS